MRILIYIINLFRVAFWDKIGFIFGYSLGKYLFLFKKEKFMFYFLSSSNIGELMPEITHLKKFLEDKNSIRTIKQVYIVKGSLINIFLEDILTKLINEINNKNHFKIILINFEILSINEGIKKGLQVIIKKYNLNKFLVLPLKSDNFTIEEKTSQLFGSEIFKNYKIDNILQNLDQDYNFNVNDKYVAILINNDLYKMDNSIGGFFSYGNPRSNYGGLRNLSTNYLNDSIDYILSKNFKVLILCRSNKRSEFNFRNPDIIDLSMLLGKFIPDFMDFYLIKYANFALTTGTGADTILRYFSIPHLKINHYSYNFTSNLANCLVIPTVYKDKHENYPQTWSKIAIIQNKYGVQYNRRFWNNLGLNYELPSSSQILEGTKELVKIYNSGADIVPKHNNVLWRENAMRYDKMKKHSSFLNKNVAICEDFLSKNDSWLLN